ncbi:3318_t:CDS:1, partial [Racocetra persica]
LLLKISSHKREEIIVNTPSDYVNLYTKCWSSNSFQRPTSDEILNELKKLSSEVTVDSITNNYAEMKK